MARKITEKEKAEIIKLRTENNSWREISKALKISTNTIQKYYNESPKEIVQSKSADIDGAVNTIRNKVRECIRILKEQSAGPIAPWVEGELQKESIWINAYEDFDIGDVYEFNNWVFKQGLNQEGIIMLKDVWTRFRKAGWTADNFVNWMTKTHNINDWLPEDYTEYFWKLIEWAKSNKWTPQGFVDNFEDYSNFIVNHFSKKDELRQLEQVIKEKQEQLKQIEERIVTLMNEDGTIRLEAVYHQARKELLPNVKQFLINHPEQIFT